MGLKQEFTLSQSGKELDLHISSEQWINDKCCAQETGPGCSSVLHFYFSFLFCRDINKTIHCIWNANGSQVTSKEGSIIKLTECQWQK